LSFAAIVVEAFQ